MTRLKKSTLICSAMGNSPKIVVTVVSNTGRRRCAQALSDASMALIPECLRRLNVSIKTMELFTTIPANATMPVPVMMIEKVCPVTIIPIKTPAIETTIVESVMIA